VAALVCSILVFLHLTTTTTTTTAMIMVTTLLLLLLMVKRNTVHCFFHQLVHS
jgi:hypothetical protein